MLPVIPKIKLPPLPSNLLPLSPVSPKITKKKKTKTSTKTNLPLVPTTPLIVSTLPSLPTTLKTIPSPVLTTLKTVPLPISSPVLTRLENKDVDIWKDKSLKDYGSYMSEEKMVELKGKNTWNQFYDDVLSSYKLVRRADGTHFVTNMIDEVENLHIDDINLMILEKGTGNSLYTYDNPHSKIKFPYFTNETKAKKYWKSKYQSDMGKLGSEYKLKKLYFIESIKKFQPYDFIKSDVPI